MAKTKFAIGIGGNLGNTATVMTRSLQTLDQHAKITILSVASLYRSPPWGNRNQPAFLNTCAILESDLTPTPLLRHLQAIEKRYGRVRRVRWGARTLDLDILWWSEGRVAKPGLTVPHPRMTKRAFVLKPLLELAPNIIVSNQTVQDVYDRLPARERDSVVLLEAVQHPQSA